MRNYLLRSAIFLCFLLMAALPISFSGIGQCVAGDINSCGLLHYQQHKIDTATQPIDTAFFGDSSLGNAVDNNVFTTLRGKPTLNLALNGTMGLPVIYLQMKEAFGHVPIRNAVIMLSPEAYRHHFSKGADSFVLAGKTDPELMFGLSPRIAVDSAVSLTSLLFDADMLKAGFGNLLYGSRVEGECRGCDRLDYVQQSNKKVLPGDGDLTVWNGPYGDYDPFLRRIAALCRRDHVNCLYMHGPLMQEVVDLNPTYVDQVDRKLIKAGLPLVGEQPILIPTAEVGNAVNHVRPDLRPAYTKRIYALLQSRLQ